MNETTNQGVREFTQFFSQSGSYRSVLLLAIAVVVAYWVSQIVAMAFIKAAQLIAVRADNSPDETKLIRLRRVETYLSITVALMRALIVAVTAYVVWRLLSPGGNETIAAIGASALFVVLASGTIGSILKDVTAGATMIIERWFTIGDYIKIEPFAHVSGVVERATLRSTKLRALNGEEIWVHNQYIQAVRVTPRGVRTVAVDIFVKDKTKAHEEINKIISTLPIGPTLLAKKPKITITEKWATNLWRITVVGQTLPGREWLIENYFVDALEELDDTLMAQKPIVRIADPVAEKRFKRAVRIKK